jgi:hypothetical protein
MTYAITWDDWSRVAALRSRAATSLRTDSHASTMLGVARNTKWRNDEQS